MFNLSISWLLVSICEVSYDLSLSISFYRVGSAFVLASSKSFSKFIIIDYKDYIFSLYIFLSFSCFSLLFAAKDSFICLTSSYFDLSCYLLISDIFSYKDSTSFCNFLFLKASKSCSSNLFPHF